MYPFEYRTADTPAEALGYYSDVANARYLAGGTTLVDLMKLEVEAPARLVDVNGLSLTTIDAIPSGGLRIGAMVKNSDLAADQRIRSAYPVLAEALLSGASPQIRNMATAGGNLLQRTRCYYFRDTPFPCNKRLPGSGCPAIGGINRIHAVLGTSDHCIATHPSDMCVALAALDAVIVTQNASVERRIAITDFHTLPGSQPEIETALASGEIITAVELPEMPFFSRSHYLKVRDRSSYSFALASAAVALEIESGHVKNARVALGGVATKPWRSREAEEALVGKPAVNGTYRDAAEAALHGAKAQRDNGFKIDLAKRTLVRALTRVGELA